MTNQTESAKSKHRYANVEPDHERSAEVFTELLRVFRAREHPFTRYRSIFGPPFEPENFPADPKFRLNYYLALCLYMKGQVESPVAQARLSRLAADKPELFDPGYWARERGQAQRVARLVADLKDRGLGTGVDKYHRHHWPFNYRKIDRYWGGDARRVFEFSAGESWSFEAFLRRVRNRGRMSADIPDGLFGFQIKMAALLAHFGVVVGAVDPVSMRYPLPVDIHVARLLLNTGALKVTRSDGVDPAADGYVLRYGQTVRAGVQSSLRFLEETGENSYELAEAAWNYMEMCGSRPSLWVIRGERRGRATSIDCLPVPDNERTRRRYEATCLECALRAGCNRRLSVGSKPYFLHGVLEARPAPFPETWPLDPPTEHPLYVPPSRTVGKMGVWWRRGEGPYEPIYVKASASAGALQQDWFGELLEQSGNARALHDTLPLWGNSPA